MRVEPIPFALFWPKTGSLINIMHANDAKTMASEPKIFDNRLNILLTFTAKTSLFIF